VRKKYIYFWDTAVLASALVCQTDAPLMRYWCMLCPYCHVSRPTSSLSSSFLAWRRTTLVLHPWDGFKKKKKKRSSERLCRI